jgi:hypothetical protein
MTDPFDEIAAGLGDVAEAAAEAAEIDARTTLCCAWQSTSFTQTVFSLKRSGPGLWSQSRHDCRR